MSDTTDEELMEIIEDVPFVKLSDEERRDFRADMRADGVQCTTNPTRIDKPYWKFMIAHGNQRAADARESLEFPKRMQPIENGGYTWIREPVFCFNRVGRTETKLPDGHIIYIGGKHEKWDDPDYVIYNDVVVVHRREPPPEFSNPSAGPRDIEIRSFAQPEDIEIYGYPWDVFPPTFFHTACYYKDEGIGKEYIYIIGGSHRVHRLDLHDYSIQRIETSGEAPPVVDWTERFHPERGAWCEGGRIVVWDWPDNNFYALCLADMRWPRNL
jgi:hypothetical protein